jgi:uncharacterized protein (TIRG00374 family)
MTDADAPATAPPRPFYRRKWFTVVVGLAVTLGCIAAALWSMTRTQSLGEVLASMGTAFRRADYRTLPLLWGILFVFYWLKGVRWTRLLSPLGTFSTQDAFRPVMIGFAFNNLLPAHLGEFVRVFVFARHHQVAKSAVLTTVVLERIFDILAILAFFLAGLLFVPGLPDELRKVAWVFAGLVGLALVGAAVFLVWTKPFVALFESLLAKIPGVPASLRAKIVGMLEAGAAGLASLKSPVLVARILGNSFVQWGLNGLLMHLSLWSFGIEVSPLASCLLLGVVAFGVTIPSSPGYFGVVNALFVAVINERTVGITDEPAVFAASIFYHMSGYVPVTLLGLYYFNRTGLSVSQVERAAENGREAAQPPRT